MVAAGTPSTTYWDRVPAGGMGAGYFDGTVKAERSFFDMAVPSALRGAPVTVLSATLTGTVSHAGSSASTSHTVSLYSAGAVSSATSWDTMPAHSAGPVASATFTTASATPALAVSWNVKSMIQDAADSGLSDTVVELISSAESSSEAARFTGFTRTATLTVTYEPTISLVSLAPGVIEAGLSYAATLVVHSATSVAVQAITVAVRDSSNDNLDFPGARSATLNGVYVFTSGAKSFAAGTYTEFGSYKINNIWYPFASRTLTRKRHSGGRFRRPVADQARDVRLQPARWLRSRT